MRKVLCTAIVIAFCLGTMAYAQQGPATVTINAAMKKQGPVQFNHDKHVVRAKTCDKCHHTNKGMKTDAGAKVQKCSACHLDSKDPKVPSMREMSQQKNPFHSLCIGCHKQQQPKKGPTTCTACHAKK